MSNWTIGPRLGMFLAMFCIMAAFISGTVTGAKSTIAQGLVNKLEVLTKDSKVANEIRAEREDDIKEVEEGFHEIKLSDCAKRFSMRELMGLPK